MLLVVVTLVIVGLLPLAVMLGKSVIVDGRLTFAVYEKLFSNSGQYWVPIRHSLMLAALTAGGATLTGVPLGLLLGKTDLPMRRILAILFSIPLLLPPYILAVCWFNLLASDGILAPIIPERTLELLSHRLFDLPGCLWVLVSAFMPLVMILTLACLHAVNPRLEEAGRLIARWPAVLWRVTLPAILPGILFAAILVFLLALGEVGVPMYLRYPVLPVETLTQFAAFYDFGAAAAAASPLLAIVLAVLALEHLLLRDQTYRLRPTTPGRRMLSIRLRGWRVPAMLVVGLLATAIVVLPLLALIVSSLSPFAYGDAWLRAADALGRSLVFAGVGATLLTAVGFLCGYLIHNRALRIWRAVDTLTLLLFTLPGTVIGIGLVALWNRSGSAFLYASSALVIFAYIAQYTALTSRISTATLANVPPSLEEAAQMIGAPWFARLAYVVVPAAFPGVLAAWFTAFIFCFRDLGASMVVYPAGQDTLPVRIFTLMANGAPSLIAALCVLLVSVTLIAMAILGLLFQGWALRR
ncbi:MAG: iron ABC transporter permease [Gammaproteobacteria bacterium]|nr:iron ABC transporter permease [Gammaproteobacteria bacterium]